MKPLIQSLQNPRIKELVRLRESRTRRRSGKILIDGVRETLAAIRAGVEIEEVFFAEGKEDSSIGSIPRDLSSGLPSERLQPVTDQVFERICYGDRDSGLVAVAKPPGTELARLNASHQSLVIVLDQPEKPGNVGAVLRTASAAGVDAVILCDATCEVFNPNAIRASLGTIFSVPLAAGSFDETVAWLQCRKMQVFRACVDGAVGLWDCNFTGAAAIIFGSEAHGLGPRWRDIEGSALKIPMVGTADSLNLSISAAVVMYEAVRQQSAFKG